MGEEGAVCSSIASFLMNTAVTPFSRPAEIGSSNCVDSEGLPVNTMIHGVWRLLSLHSNQFYSWVISSLGEQVLTHGENEQKQIGEKCDEYRDEWKEN